VRYLTNRWQELATDDVAGFGGLRMWTGRAIRASLRLFLAEKSHGREREGTDELGNRVGSEQYLICDSCNRRRHISQFKTKRAPTIDFVGLYAESTVSW
jgi:hypothetical protein